MACIAGCALSFVLAVIIFAGVTRITLDLIALRRRFKVKMHGLHLVEDEEQCSG